MHGLGPRINIVDDELKTKDSEKTAQKHPEKSFTTEVPKIQLQPNDTSRSRDIVESSVDLGDHMNIHLEN
jgi:hypothetical protein